MFNVYRVQPTHRPKLEDRHWYNFKALLKWPDNLGRWVGRFGTWSCLDYNHEDHIALKIKLKDNFYDALHFKKKDLSEIFVMGIQATGMKNVLWFLLIHLNICTVCSPSSQ